MVYRILEEQVHILSDMQELREMMATSEAVLFPPAPPYLKLLKEKVLLYCRDSISCKGKCMPFGVTPKRRDWLWSNKEPQAVRLRALD